MSELIKIDNGAALLDPITIKDLAILETEAKRIKAKADELKAAILAEMESKNIIKIDNDILTISYIASTDRETLDSKKLRAELPDIYDEYIEIKPVKASIRIKVK